MRLLPCTLPALLCLLLLIACGQQDRITAPTPTQIPTAAPTITPSPTHTPIPTPTPEPPPTHTPTPTRTPAPTPFAAASSAATADHQSQSDIISSAIAAMQELETFHADVDASFKIVQPEASFRMDEETFGTEFPISYSGDFQSPDLTSGRLGISLGFLLLETNIITIGEHAYITNPQSGAWEKLYLEYAGLPNPNQMIRPPADPSLYKDIRIIGEQTIDGTTTQQISATLNTVILGSAYDNLYIQMWIGKEDSLVRRITLTGETSIDEQDTAGLSDTIAPLGAADIGGKAELTMTITYSNFNHPLNIEPPIP